MTASDIWQRSRHDIGVRLRARATYESVLVADVVGQLELVEGDHLLHPLLAGGRAVRVDIHALRHLRVSLAGDHPAAVEGQIYHRLEAG